METSIKEGAWAVSAKQALVRCECNKSCAVLIHIEESPIRHSLRKAGIKFCQASVGLQAASLLLTASISYSASIFSGVTLDVGFESHIPYGNN